MIPASNKPSEIVTYRLDKLEEKLKERDDIIVTALNRMDEKMDGVCQSVSLLDTGRGINAANISALCERVDTLGDRVKTNENRVYGFAGLNAIFTSAAAWIMSRLGL